MTCRGHRCASFEVTDFPDGEEDKVEISPTLPLLPRNLENEFADIDAFFLRALSAGYIHAAEALVSAGGSIKCDCIFFSFDGLFRALLPGARLDRLRAIHPLHGEGFIANFTALHHQASMQLCGKPAVVCMKSRSWQDANGAFILIVTDPYKIEGSFIKVTRNIDSNAISNELGGIFKITKHNLLSITHDQPISPRPGDIVHVHEQPQGRMVPSLFPSLRLEYFEKVSAPSRATQHDPIESDSQNETADDPIEDVSPVEPRDRTINILSSTEEPQGPESSLVERDLEGGGVLDEHLQTVAPQAQGEADLDHLRHIDLRRWRNKEKEKAEEP